MSFRDELIDRAIAAAYTVPLDAVTARRFDVGEIERGKYARAVDAICDTVGAETTRACRVCADRDAPISERAAQLTLPLAGAHCDPRSFEPPDAICNVCGLPRDRAVTPHCRCRV